LPLSTPLNAGPETDALLAAIVLATLSAFVYGVNDLTRRVVPRAQATADPLAVGSYGALAVVGFSVALMMLGLPSVAIAQGVTVATTAWGGARAVSRVPEAWRWANRAPVVDLVRRITIGAAMGWTVIFWMGVFRAHVALPVYHDGIAHTTYYLRILDAGVPTLGRVPIGFSNLFGLQLFPFYPTGTHTLLAVTAGLWGEWGLATHAGILKACFTLTLAALPWAFYWFVRRLVPTMPWWIALAVALLAIAGFRFPIEAAHEGGASRLIAHLVMLPVYADTLAGKFDALNRRLAAGAVLALAFLLHPSVCVTLAVLLVYSTLHVLVADTAMRARLVRCGGLAIALAVAGALVAGVLLWNHAEAEARDAVLPFSWGGLFTRWSEGWTALFSAEYGMAPYQPWIVGLGLLTIVGRRRILQVSGRVAGYPFWMALFALFVLATRVVSFPGSRALGGAFWDEAPRVIESQFEAVGLSMAMAIWGVWHLAVGRRLTKVGEGHRASRMGTAFALVVVIIALGYQVSRRSWLVAHIGHWDRQFRTSRVANLQELGAWIMRSTPADALLFHEPFDAEIWEAWTGRRGIFMYAECPVINDLIPCRRRRAFVADEIDVLRRRLATPEPADRCLSPVDAFGRPAYFLLPVQTSMRPTVLCRDAVLVAVLDRHAVIEYRKPDGPAP